METPPKKYKDMTPEQRKEYNRIQQQESREKKKQLGIPKNMPFKFKNLTREEQEEIRRKRREERKKHYDPEKQRQNYNPEKQKEYNKKQKQKRDFLKQMGDVNTALSEQEQEPEQELPLLTEQELELLPEPLQEQLQLPLFNFNPLNLFNNLSGLNEESLFPDFEERLEGMGMFDRQIQSLQRKLKGGMEEGEYTETIDPRQRRSKRDALPPLPVSANANPDWDDYVEFSGEEEEPIYESIDGDDEEEDERARKMIEAIRFMDERRRLTTTDPSIPTAPFAPLEESRLRRHNRPNEATAIALEERDTKKRDKMDREEAELERRKIERMRRGDRERRDAEDAEILRRNLGDKASADFGRLKAKYFGPKESKYIPDVIGRNEGRFIPEGSGVFSSIKDVGKKVINKGKDLYNKAKDIVSSATKLNNTSRKTLEKFGKQKIKNIIATREVVQKSVTTLINLISAGQLDKEKKKMGYDDFFHIRLYCEMESGAYILLEKNEVVYIYPKTEIKGEKLPINQSKPNLTLNELVNKTIEYMGEKDFYTYDAFTNNCASFVISILKANGLWSENDKSFLLQDVQYLKDKLPKTKQVASFITQLGAVVSRARGKGMKGGQITITSNNELPKIFIDVKNTITDGYLEATFFTDTNKLKIDNLYLSPETQGQGDGTELFKKLMTYIADNITDIDNITKITLVYGGHSSNALKYYIKIMDYYGFRMTHPVLLEKGVKLNGEKLQQLHRTLGMTKITFKRDGEVGAGKRKKTKYGGMENEVLPPFAPPMNMNDEEEEEEEEEDDFFDGEPNEEGYDSLESDDEDTQYHNLINDYAVEFGYDDEEEAQESIQELYDISDPEWNEMPTQDVIKIIKKLLKHKSVVTTLLANQHMNNPLPHNVMKDIIDQFR